MPSNRDLFLKSGVLASSSCPSLVTKIFLSRLPRAQAENNLLPRYRTEDDSE
jgi:hypothetical protein